MMKWLRAFWKFLNREISFAKKPKRPAPKEKKPEPRPGLRPEKKHFFIRPADELLHIQVGLDFGTNCSKACYSVIGSSHKVFPVIFDHKLSSFPAFAMPSVAMFDTQKKMLLGDHAATILEDQKWGCGLRNFKTLLAAIDEHSFRDRASEKMFREHMAKHELDPKEINPYIVTATYIAYLMHTIKKYIANKFKTKKLNLSFNICIPVDYIVRNHVKIEFENAFALAAAVEKKWESGDDDFNPMDTALSLKNEIKYDEKDPETRIFAIPEAVAEVVAYLKSSKKKTGMHALIDFGSGTTDVSIFNITRGVEEHSFWYSASAIPYGVFQIEKALIGCLGKDQGGDSLKSIFDIIKNMSSKSEKYRNFLDCTRNELSSFFASRDYKGVWTEAYKHLKKERFWKDVKIFISGGGSQLPYIRDFSSTPWWSHIEGRYEVDSLVKPEDFDIAPSIPFYRMAVAYGLTWPKPMLRGYVLPKDAPDHTPPPLLQKEMPDRDDLYPK